MDNPYCSCKLTCVRAADLNTCSNKYKNPRTVEKPISLRRPMRGVGCATAYSCKPYGESLLQL